MAKGKDLFRDFIDLEKAHNRVGRDVLSHAMRLYGVGGKLLKAVLELLYGQYEMSDWFSLKGVVRQGCVMSLWLFHLYMDGVVREVQATTLGKEAELVSDGEEN